MSDLLLERLLNETVQYLTKRPDGSFYLRVDEGIDISQEEAELIWRVWGQTWYRTVEKRDDGEYEVVVEGPAP